ncbi:TetR/AcrR family transcriptional regulator [Gilvimarinus chinensis]|uniref:TetR/AcrR family transcriptional regulator n=1 Tax=Gilvimarinus chinensis TaxID=396005 RepID=UPI00035CFCBB|nr:TetR/AcrR family transcriptional regulator [Gilvimarinus chinensis]
MGWKSEHKQHTKARILSAAGQLFTRLGYERVSIDDVMDAAGLTRGAFYAHFRSKSQLYAEAIVAAASSAREYLLRSSHDLNTQELAARYLGVGRITGDKNPCPLAFLATDIQQREEPVRKAYTRVFQGLVTTITRAGGFEDGADEALRNAVLMVGGVALARAVNDSALAEQILRVCREGIASQA